MSIVTERVAVRDAARDILAAEVRRYREAWGEEWTAEKLVQEFAQSGQGHSSPSRAMFPDGHPTPGRWGHGWKWGSGSCWEEGGPPYRKIRSWDAQHVSVTQINGEPCCEVFTLAEIAATVEGTAAVQRGTL